VLERPQLTAVRDARGWNLATLGRGAAHARGPHAGGGTRDDEDRRLAAVVVALLDVRDGTLRLVDRRTTPPAELTVRHAAVRASDLRVDAPMRVHVTAAILDDDPNLVVDASVGPLGDLPPPALDAVPLDLRVALDDLDIGPLRAAAPGLRLPATIPDDAAILAHAHAQGTLATLTVDGRAELAKLAAQVAGTVHASALPVAVDLRVETPRLDMDDVAMLLPALAAAEPSGTIDAHLQVRGPIARDAVPALTGTVGLQDVGLDAAGARGITTTIRCDGNRIELPATRLQLGGETPEVSGVARVDGPTITVERAHVDGFGGTVEATGRVEAPPGAPLRLALQASARDVGVARLLALRNPGAAQPLDGRLQGEVALTTSGGNARTLRRSLAGTARGRIVDGVLRDVNLADRVVESVTGIAGLAGLAPAKLRQQHPELFGAADTHFEELRASARLAGMVAQVDEAVMSGPGYVMQATGTMRLDGPLDLRGTFTAREGLTKDLVAAVHEARWLLDARGQLAIPFHLTGTPPKVRVEPDASLARRALEGALGDVGGAAKPGKPRPSTEELLRRGLERLLGR